MLRAHLNPASRAQRVSRVQHQVGHDALDLFAVGENPRQRLKLSRQFDVRHLVDSVERLTHELIQIGVDADGVGPLPKSAQTGDHVIDSPRGIADAAQRVLPKRGVVEMHRQILQHQIERRSRILQVVHEERGHRPERLEFLGARPPHSRVEDSAGPR